MEIKKDGDAKDVQISAVSHGNPGGGAEDAVVRSMPSVQCGGARTSGRLPNAQEVPHYYDEANQLKEIRDGGGLELPNYHCAQDVLKRVEKTFKAFFNRIKKGQKPGFPRFKPARRYHSITFPSHGDGNKLLEKHLRVQEVGEIQIKLHRPITGKIKTVSVKREGQQWYACFSVECQPKPLPST